MRQLTASEISFVSGADSGDELLEAVVEVMAEVFIQIAAEIFVEIMFRSIENTYHYFYPQTLKDSVFVPRRR